MSTNLIKVNEKEIKRISYKNQAVISAETIAELHQKELREVNQQFERNKEKLIENEDYFRILKTDSESQSVIQDLFKVNNQKEVYLFTESGYLLLVKTFRDDLSWDIQRILIKSYFKLKEIKSRTKNQEQLPIAIENEVTEYFENPEGFIVAKVPNDYCYAFNKNDIVFVGKNNNFTGSGYYLLKINGCLLIRWIQKHTFSTNLHICTNNPKDLKGFNVPADQTDYIKSIIVGYIAGSLGAFANTVFNRLKVA